MKCDHYCWESNLQVWKRLHPDFRKLRDVGKTYDKIRHFYALDPAAGSLGDRGASLLQTIAEEEWYRLGKPYYKLWPGITRHLMTTNIDIAGSYLHLPFRVFEIRLPKTDPLYERPNRLARSILLFQYDEEWLSSKGHSLQKHDDRDWTVYLYYQVESAYDLSVNWMGWFYAMGIWKDKKISTFVNEGFNQSSPDGYTPSPEFVLGLFRLAISVCFFGIHAHDLVCPDIPQRYIDRWHRARKNKDKTEAQKLLDRAKEMGHFGWKIGSEIDLPCPQVVHHTLDGSVQPGGGKELTAGHLRSGHLRLQPYGPREEPTKHELIFIPPTVVRPDLPLRDVRGFRLRDDLLGGGQ